MYDSAVLSGRASLTVISMNREENVPASQDESQDRQTYLDAHHHYHPQAVVLRRLENRQRRTEESLVIPAPDPGIFERGVHR